MVDSVMESYKEFISLYNQYRQGGDSNSALRIAKQIDYLARTQCARKDLPKQVINFYMSTAAPVREWMASINVKPVQQSASGSSLSESEDKIKSTDWFGADAPKLTMDDVVGLQTLKDEFKVNVLAPLDEKYSSIYKRYRKDIGTLQILLYGPPGCGKTHIVKCLAGELKCKIAVVQVKDVLANLVGDGEKIIAEIFEQAKKYDRCIIFFDEIDAIAASRDDDESRHTKGQLTTLLTNMDGFASSTKPGQIRVIIAATNRPWVLDSALKRGGRFDTQMQVPLPDFEARARLIELAFGKDESVKDRVDVPCADDVSVDWLAERLEGYSGGDIKAICRQIISRPLKREIMNLDDYGNIFPDCVTREDCEFVLDMYINPTSDETLFRFDAYASNMPLDEYLALYEPIARAAYENGEELPAYVRRWLERIDGVYGE